MEMSALRNQIFEEYYTGIDTIYGQLEASLRVKVEPVPDEWDRLYDVDFHIKIDSKYIGLQIRSVSEGDQLPKFFKKCSSQAKTHEKFGGKVFYVFSAKVNGRKEIVNREVVNEIVDEIGGWGRNNMWFC